MISINRSLIYDRIKSGIPNIENTCYLNSFLQILASNNEFCEKIQHTENRLLSTLSSLLSSIRNPGSGNIKQLVRLFINQVNAEFPMVMFT
ncbi:unnamed protein product [Blepharisma stoltei]|uniref:USP domain-containing protein n=1 Tax=Blepharisma stoltei TaxID=1481888 RepID=A0AAU9KF76_9CILI|nr:unnamed protein product [Blepharisma stoltei]